MTVPAGDWLYVRSFCMALGEKNLEILATLIGIPRKWSGEMLQLTFDKTDISAIRCSISSNGKRHFVCGMHEARHRRSSRHEHHELSADWYESRNGISAVICWISATRGSLGKPVAGV
jgi:hypothetical protein